MTERGALLAYAELVKLAPDDLDTQRKILDNSVLHSWKGLFPLQRDPPQETAPPASYDIEEMERRLLYGPIVYKKQDDPPAAARESVC